MSRPRLSQSPVLHPPVRVFWGQLAEFADELHLAGRQLVRVRPHHSDQAAQDLDPVLLLRLLATQGKEEEERKD